MLPPDYQALTTGVAYLDLSARGRLCLLGADRIAFLHGQVTNNIKDMPPGRGCYAALADHKAKMQADLFIYNLGEELLLDFEPDLSAKVTTRLEKFIIADDVQIVDASTAFGLLTLVGPEAPALAGELGYPELSPFDIRPLGDAYVAATPRFGQPAVDIFCPLASQAELAKRLRSIGAVVASKETAEVVRIENGVPRFGADMDEGTLVPEALGENAISYTKGCYIGQEVISRIRAYGQVAKALRGLRFEPTAAVPNAGDKIQREGKEVGHITSAVFSPKLQRPIALGYVRKECNQIGSRLRVNDADAEIVPLPFAP